MAPLSIEEETGTSSSFLEMESNTTTTTAAADSSHQVESSSLYPEKDNAPLLSCLVNGSSSVCEGDVIIGETWSRIQGLGAFPWFDRVDSAANPVDGLSRGRLSGPWRSVDRLAFPVSLLPSHRRAVGRTGGPSEA